MKKFLLALLLLAKPVYAQQQFSALVGPVGVENVKEGNPVHIPYITWGGDVAAFAANGGLTTAKGSIYDNLGLNIQFTKGDDFVQQVRDYMVGKSPFLRGTVAMLGMASEVTGSDPRTQPVIIVQLTWSAGDHVVAREEIKTLNDLVKKGKKTKIACQQGGPHVGLLYEIIAAAQGSKNDVEIVWTKDLAGPEGPAEAFRKDPKIDACCVITPDMLGLTGGQDQVGSGAEGTVGGAHVVVSTQQMSRAIPDVWAVRPDWYKTHKDFVEKFDGGFLLGCDKTVKMRKEFTETNKLTPDYRKLLETAQKAFGKEVIPSLEVDGHGLLLDAVFVGLGGQVSFFEDKGNLNGYEAKTKNALDLATSWGYAKNRRGFTPPGLDYQKMAEATGLAYEAVKNTDRILAEGVDLYPDSDLDSRTILSFEIKFEPNQETFSVDQYAAEFQRALQLSSTFGNAVVAIRGHTDPAQTLVNLVKAGMAKGVIKRQGNAGGYKYYLNGQELNLADTQDVIKLITEGSFDGVEPSPRETMQAALNLSKKRSEAARKALLEFGDKMGTTFDSSQIQAVGAGILEPVIARPRNLDESKQNMRVEFRILRISAEAVKQSDYDY